jgi:hypothetical protein
MIDRDDDEARIEAVRRRHIMNRNTGDESWRDIDALLAELDRLWVDKEEELRAADEARDEEISTIEYQHHIRVDDLNSKIDDLEHQLNDGLVGLSMRAAEELSLP